jgi:acetylornithine deacetylase
VNAHLDTVPPNAGWTGDPFEPRRVDGGVMGLGAADTKGAIAATLAALDAGRPRDVMVLFSGDEELGGACMKAFVDSGAAGAARRAIVGEPTSCRAGTRHRGVLAVDVRFAGEGGHSSKADRLPAPIVGAAKVAVLCHAWGDRRKDLGPPGFPGLCFNAAKIDGGVAFNVVPKQAVLSMSLRPPPGVKSEQLLHELRALVGAAGTGGALEVVLDNPSFQTRDPAGFRDLLGDVVDAPIDLAFWTEAAVFAAAGIDAVVFGPGDIARAHAADEWVPIADLEQARGVLAGVVSGAR